MPTTIRAKPSLFSTLQEWGAAPQAGGILLILCTLVSLTLANSPAAPAWLGLWHLPLAGLSVELWVNDALMAVFFLLVGLELRRELVSGALSSPQKALLPVVAACGGVIVPALIHYGFNGGTPSQAGMGIPMATDIAFALGVLALLGKRVPLALKVFLTALAVIDDLAAIVVIAVFYTAQLSALWLAAAAAMLVLLYALQRWTGVRSLALYLVGGAVLWVCMFKSGVHATVAGVLLAFVIPAVPAARLEHALHKPVVFGILPLFALANTAVVISPGWAATLASHNSLGIMLGLIVGKPLGIVLASFAAVTAGLCRLPPELGWRHITGAGMLGGIGFTMSIFITNLAFTGQGALVDASKMAILSASLVAAVQGLTWLRWQTRNGRNSNDLS